jgi:hypothetical protein
MTGQGILRVTSIGKKGGDDVSSKFQSKLGGEDISLTNVTPLAFNPPLSNKQNATAGHTVVSESRSRADSRVAGGQKSGATSGPPGAPGSRGSSVNKRFPIYSAYQTGKLQQKPGQGGKFLNQRGVAMLDPVAAAQNVGIMQGVGVLPKTEGRKSSLQPQPTVQSP